MDKLLNADLREGLICAAAAVTSILGLLGALYVVKHAPDLYSHGVASGLVRLGVTAGLIAAEFIACAGLFKIAKSRIERQFPDPPEPSKNTETSPPPARVRIVKKDNGDSE